MFYTSDLKETSAEKYGCAKIKAVSPLHESYEEEEIR